MQSLSLSYLAHACQLAAVNNLVPFSLASNPPGRLHMNCRG